MPYSKYLPIDYAFFSLKTILKSYVNEKNRKIIFL